MTDIGSFSQHADERNAERAFDDLLRENRWFVNGLGWKLCVPIKRAKFLSLFVGGTRRLCSPDERAEEPLNYR